MSIYKKLQEARNHIKSMDLKKQGFNSYSKYNYYTPEQINHLVNTACNKFNLLPKFDLVRNEHGLQGILTIIDLDGTDLIPEIKFTQATDIPQIKATNITQQIGGAVTYTQRYLLMTAFDIVDNNLDFDTDKNDKPKDSTGNQLIYIENLLQTSAILPEDEENIRNKMENYTADEAKRCINYLKDNQIPSNNPSAKEIKEQVQTKIDLDN